ncbi:MAG: hypothetical protein ACQZ3M_06200 [cyanobacterium endosymbiont of Rhopalodia fuxianensis]
MQIYRVVGIDSSSHQNHKVHFYMSKQMCSELYRLTISIKVKAFDPDNLLMDNLIHYHPLKDYLRGLVIMT